MTEDWRESLDHRQPVAAIVADLNKAFDSINHNLLLAKLKAYRFSTLALELMSLYLIGRQQSVKVQGACCSYWVVMAGVPQGSFLSPLLFNIFMNDLQYCVPTISPRLYADDTTGYASDTTPAALEFITNYDLWYLSTWLVHNYLFC